MQKKLKIVLVGLALGLSVSHAQLLSSGNRSVPVINKSFLLYDPSRDDSKIADSEMQEPSAPADSTIEAQIPSTLKPASRNEDVADKVEKTGCVVGTAALLMDIFASGGKRIFLGKPICW
ncbi:MAG: hypothetical protein MJY99_05590 [Fibrobacter sp.]|nr:hypothetical protein [Fibrobacter sp.]